MHAFAARRDPFVIQTAERTRTTITQQYRGGPMVHESRPARVPDLPADVSRVSDPLWALRLRGCTSGVQPVG